MARVAVKRIANAAATVLVAAPIIVYKLMALPLGIDRTFPGWSQLFSLIPGHAGIYLRRAFFRWVLAETGTDACISFGTVFSHATARVGKHVYIGVGCMVGDATLEDDVLVGSHVSIINGSRQHSITRLDLPVREQPGFYPRITIGEDSWIGDRAVVMANLGRHAVVGAGAVVTKSVPDFAIVAGNPARVIGTRNPEMPNEPTPRDAVGIRTCQENL